MSSFAERLKIAMLTNGITNTELCRRSGFDQTGISHFTTGQREPTRESLARLLRAMPNVDARWLVVGENNGLGCMPAESAAPPALFSEGWRTIDAIREAEGMT